MESLSLPLDEDHLGGGAGIASAEVPKQELLWHPVGAAFQWCPGEGGREEAGDASL